MDEKEYLTAMVSGAKKPALSLYVRRPNPMFLEVGWEVLRDVQGWGAPTIKPARKKIFLTHARRAEEIGVPAIATTSTPRESSI